MGQVDARMCARGWVRVQRVAGFPPDGCAFGCRQGGRGRLESLHRARRDLASPQRGLDQGAKDQGVSHPSAPMNRRNIPQDSVMREPWLEHARSSHRLNDRCTRLSGCSPTPPGADPGRHFHQGWSNRCRTSCWCAAHTGADASNTCEGVSPFVGPIPTSTTT